MNSYTNNAWGTKGPKGPLILVLTTFFKQHVVSIAFQKIQASTIVTQGAPSGGVGYLSTSTNRLVDPSPFTTWGIYYICCKMTSNLTIYHWHLPQLKGIKPNPEHVLFPLHFLLGKP
jgi:hypothetical protein